MPIYDYLCDGCGTFTLMRPMAEANCGADCPTCAAASARVILTAPHLSSLTPERRRAGAVNERSAHAPRVHTGSNGTHGPGCACCTSKASSARTHRNGARDFPTKRPWMISH